MRAAGFPSRMSSTGAVGERVPAETAAGGRGRGCRARGEVSFCTCRLGPRRLREVVGMVVGGSGGLGCGCLGLQGREWVWAEPPAQWGRVRRPPWAPVSDRVPTRPLLHVCFTLYSCTDVWGSTLHVVDFVILCWC